MLRRISQVLRRLLVVLGVALLLWFPISFLCPPAPGARTPKPGLSIQTYRGTVFITLVRGRMLDLRVEDDYPSHIRTWLEPGRSRATSVGPGPLSGSWDRLWLPLWLIAAICLAWPVTSFIVARRRRTARGFEIAAAPEAPTVRQEPERGAIAPD